MGRAGGTRVYSMKSFGSLLPIEGVDVGQVSRIPAHMAWAGSRTVARIKDRDSVRRRESYRNCPVACWAEEGRSRDNFNSRSNRVPSFSFGVQQYRLAAGQRASQVARVLISLAQHKVDIRVVGLQPVETIEVGDRLGQPPFREGQPAAVDEGLGIIGIGGEPAVHLDALGLSPRLRLEERTDDPYRPDRGSYRHGRISCRRVRRLAPIQIHPTKLLLGCLRSQHQDGLPAGRCDQLSAIGAEGQGDGGAESLEAREVGDRSAGRISASRDLPGRDAVATSSTCSGENAGEVLA